MSNQKNNKAELEKISEKANTRKKSLLLQIGVFYTILALVNITFFSAMILENQTDLLLINFKYQSEDLAKTVLGQLSSIKLTQEKDNNFRILENSLKAYQLRSYTVYEITGKIWHNYPPNDKIKKVNDTTIAKSRDLNNRQSLFRARYLIELNEKDFSLELILPLEGADSKVFLLAQLSIKTIQDRLTSIYYQVAGAVIWGIIFHALFGLFIFRVIFRRIEILKKASNEMANGNLKARAVWKMNEKKGYDELDILGNSFNLMASNVEEKVDTISLLNQQIQEELSIGKEVQELFLTPDKVVEPLHPSLFYRPLREVSGDIYRYFKFKGDYQGVFFADASGHGVSAALITVITLLTLQEVIAKQISPKNLMTEVNKLLAIRLDTTYYATAVFLLFDSKGKLYATNCGHNTIFILPKNTDQRIEIKSHGPPLGLLEESVYPLQSFPIKKGDKVFVYSDGLIETEGENNEQFGLERLFQNLEETRNADNKFIKESLQEKFLEFARHYIDDVSFMLLEAP